MPARLQVRRLAAQDRHRQDPALQAPAGAGRGDGPGLNIPQARLRNQRLLGPPFGSAHEAVHALGAVQSQDYAGAKWALAQRLAEVTDADLDRDFDAGKILRTHVMRPTWHFVAPENIRWLQMLTGPRVKRLMANYFRGNEIDDALIARSNAVLAGALRGGRHLTRKELAGALQEAGIAWDGLRLTFLVMAAELDAVVCSGPRRGKQFTYALLDERAPTASTHTREHALAELVRRYFTSHGPAQLKDFAWWSGLTLADARAGLAMSSGALVSEVIAGKPHWLAPSGKRAAAPAVAHLLPNYDEYTVSYRDHDAFFDPTRVPLSSVLASVLIVGGQVRGGWRRTLAKAGVVVEMNLPQPLTASERDHLGMAAARYGRFLGMPVRLLS